MRNFKGNIRGRYKPKVFEKTYRDTTDYSGGVMHDCTKKDCLYCSMMLRIELGLMTPVTNEFRDYGEIK